MPLSEAAKEKRRRSASEYNKRPEVRARIREYYKTHKEKWLAGSKASYRKLKDDVYAAYGGYRCACCGETTEAVLAIDHVGGGGTKHRRELRRNGTTLYRWLKVNGFPVGFRVLCFNCNQATKFGACPHETVVRSLFVNALGLTGADRCHNFSR